LSHGPSRARVFTAKVIKIHVSVANISSRAAEGIEAIDSLKNLSKISMFL